MKRVTAARSTFFAASLSGGRICACAAPPMVITAATAAPEIQARRFIGYIPPSVSIGRWPVLPPIFSTGTSSLSIKVTSRLAMEGWSL